MCPPIFNLHVTSAAQTTSFAACIASRLAPGDVLLLEGDIGAGKTHFARSVVHALQDFPEDVPSPTFTLVQTYETGAGEVWHADLYRLTSPDEVVETGLQDAWDTAICMIEWPDRLGDLAPETSVTFAFGTGTDPEHRDIVVSSKAPDLWRRKLEPCFD